MSMTDKRPNDLHQHSACRTFNKQGSAVSTLDTRLSRFSRHFFGVLFKRCELLKLASISWSFLPLKNSSLAEKIQFTFTSCLCTISDSFWWHTAGENIDTYEGTSKKQKVSLPGLLLLLFFFLFIQY